MDGASAGDSTYLGASIMINYIIGDLFDTDKQVICHGVNTVGKFGAGVAGQIAKRFPEVKRAYIRKYDRDGWRLGEAQFVQTNSHDKKIIANLATQQTYGRRGKHVDYNAVAAAFDRLGEFCSLQQCGCAMPKIGTGLGGGEWSQIESALIAAVNKWDFDIEVYELKQT